MEHVNHMVRDYIFFANSMQFSKHNCLLVLGKLNHLANLVQQFSIRFAHNEYF